MSVILHTGFDNYLESIKQNFLDDKFIEINPEQINNTLLNKADLMLIGPMAANPLLLAQKVAKEDALLSTILLPEKNDFSKIKQSLLFTPFIGKSTACYYFDESSFEQIRKAAVQTAQRRKFARVEISLKQNAPTKSPKVELEQLGSFLNQAPIGTILLTKQLEVVAVNTFGRRLFNIQPFERIASLNAVFDANSTAIIIKHIQTESATRVIEINSKEQYYEITFADVVSEKGEPLDILLVTNITDRKLEDQRMRSVLDALPQMAWTTNAQGEVTYLTERWFQYTGQTFSQAMGEGWKSVVHEQDRDKFVSAWKKAVGTGEQFEKEARYRRKDGKYRWHLVRGIPIFSGPGKVSYWLGTCTDIDEHKLLEEELSLKVNESTKELLKMNSLLKKSNTDLEEFAYVASHDLKEPLRKMQAFIGMARKNTDEKLRDEFYDKVSEAANRMGRLIDDILQYSHLSRGTDFQPVDLNAITKNVLLDLEVAIKEKKAKVSSSKLPIIQGIPVQMHQLISNLISNSLKYSDKDPFIEISHSIVGSEQINDFETEKGINYLLLKFKDNGIGFEQKYAEDIFAVFKRLHGRDEYSGSGVGLAMVKKIAHNHHGFVKAEGVPGEGATFTVYLPLL